MLALLLALTFWPVRAAGVRHLVLATHTVAWMMAALLSVLVVAVILLSVAQAFGYSGMLNRRLDPLVIPIVGIVIVVYAAASFKRVYDVPWLYAGGASLGMTTLGVTAMMLVFRAVLFVATWATLPPPG